MHTRTSEHGSRIDQIGSFAAGLLIGGVSGAVTMLLLAPQSGKKTRAGMEKKGKKLRKQFVRAVEDTTAQVRTEARDVADDVTEQMQNLQQRGQDVIDEQRDAVGDGLQNLAEAVHT